MSKGYKQVSKTKRRLSYLSPSSPYTFISLTSLTCSSEGSLGTLVELFCRYFLWVQLSDNGLGSIDHSDPFHLEHPITIKYYHIYTYECKWVQWSKLKKIIHNKYKSSKNIYMSTFLWVRNPLHPFQSSDIAKISRHDLIMKT